MNSFGRNARADASTSGDYRMNRTKRLPFIVLSVLVLVVFVAAGVRWQSVSASNSETTTDASPEEFTGVFALTDQYGMRRTDRDFRGKYMLVFFGYTYCPDICPTALAVAA